MSFVYRPYGDTDLANAVEVAEGALPQTISPLTAGSYEVGRIAWAAGEVVVTDPVVSADTFFVAAATSATRFQDTGALGANVTKLRWGAKIKLAAFPTADDDRLFSQQSQQCELAFLSQGGGSGAVIVTGPVRDSGATQVLASLSTGVAVSLGVWMTIEQTVDMVAQTLVTTLDGVQIANRTFSVVPATNFFANATNRKLMFLMLTGSTGNFPTGTEVEYLEVYKTIAGVETLHKRIAGDAATVNADPWKAGDNAT